jgi:DNA gyrase/topoisomerase IV subunit A
MIEQDTIKLLRECDAGIKMGVASIDDVLPHVHSRELENILTECKRRHETLKSELQQRLDRFGDEGKNPNPIAKGMSWMKTNMKLNMEESDATIADLMTDGCNMGVKSLSRYLNQYKAAEEYSKDIAKKLIHLEAQLATDIRGYL